MNRARLSLFPALAALACTVLACTEPPNVIVVMTDDQRWDTLEHMPNLSAIAEEGVVFENAIVMSPLCCPSRASFLSGLPMDRHGVLTNRPPLGGAPAFDPDRALPVVLQELGYRTALFGKYMNAVDALEEQPPPGWDVWHAFVADGFNYYDYVVSEDGEHVFHPEYSTDWMAERAVEFIESADGPFFLLVAPFAPHFNIFHTVVPAERHVGAFSDYEPPERPAFAEQDLSNKPPFLTADPAAVVHALRPEIVRYERETLESLLAVDEAVAALVEALVARGIEDTTVLFYTSDNGMLYGEHRYIGKNLPYEESIRVPLVAWCPSRCSPRVVPEVVTNLDLSETVADLAGHKGPFGEGQSLSPFMQVLREPGSQVRSVGERRRRRPSFRRNVGRRLPNQDFVPETARIDAWFFLSSRFTAFNRSAAVPGWTAWRGATWKYILWDDGFQEYYDLASDPHELVNEIEVLTPPIDP